MPTLCVKDVPEDLSEALRFRARENGRSISAEGLAILAENVPAAKELAGRRKLLNFARRMRAQRPLSAGRSPTAEEMLREDRWR